MSRTYLKFIGYIQVIAIFLVVLGHSFHEYPDGNIGKSLFIYRSIYSFHMPLFMFVSGFLMAHTTHDQIRNPTLAKTNKYIISKIRRLMIPFLVLTSITFFPRALLSPMSDDAWDMNNLNLLESFINPDKMPIPYYWFLQSSFTLLIFCFILLVLFNKLKLRQIPIDIILIALFATLNINGTSTSIFSLNETARLGIFFALGIIYESHFQSVNKIIPWESPLFLLISFMAWIILFVITENTNYVPFCSIMGIIMVISLTKIVEQKHILIFDRFLGASYMIFLLSWYFNVLFQQILTHYISMPWYIHTVLSLTAGIAIPWQFYKYLENHPKSVIARFSAQLLGQSYRSRH